jgi:hypothetical protein
MIMFDPPTGAGKIIFEIETLKKRIADIVINDIEVNKQFTADAIYSMLPYVAQAIAKQEALKQDDKLNNRI